MPARRGPHLAVPAAGRDHRLAPGSVAAAVTGTTSMATTHPPAPLSRPPEVGVRRCLGGTTVSATDPVVDLGGWAGGPLADRERCRRGAVPAAPPQGFVAVRVVGTTGTATHPGRALRAARRTAGACLAPWPVRAAQGDAPHRGCVGL